KGSGLAKRAESERQRRPIAVPAKPSARPQASLTAAPAESSPSDFEASLPTAKRIPVDSPLTSAEIYGHLQSQRWRELDSPGDMGRALEETRDTLEKKLRAVDEAQARLTGTLEEFPRLTASSLAEGDASVDRALEAFLDAADSVRMAQSEVARV